MQGNPYPGDRLDVWQLAYALHIGCVVAVDKNGIVPFAHTDNTQLLGAYLLEILITHGQVGGVDGNAKTMAPVDRLVGEKLLGFVDRETTSALVLELDTEGVVLIAGIFYSRRRPMDGCQDNGRHHGKGDEQKWSLRHVLIRVFCKIGCKLTVNLSKYQIFSGKSCNSQQNLVTLHANF